MPDNDISTVILVTLVAYKAVLIGIGFWAARRIRDPADFLLGGRKLGPLVAGMSYAASTSSAWVLLGYSGFVFVAGISAAWMLPGIWGGYVLMWTWFGRRIRQESAEQQWVTPTDFFAAGLERVDRKRIATLAAVLISFCFVFYIAAQFAAAAQAFVTNFNLGMNSSVILGATIILIYCLLGGFWAVSVTDTLQGFVMLLVALLVPSLAVIEAGGFGAIVDHLATTAPAMLDWRGGLSGFLLLGMLLGLTSIGLGTFGQPHLLARLMAVRGDRERQQAFVISTSWAVIVYVGMTWLALAARSLALEPGNGEQVFYLLAGQLLPPVLAGIVVAAILSAVMSTVDSLLIAASAAVSHDLRLSERFAMDKLFITRIVMTGIVIAAVLLTLLLPDTIFNRVLFAWSALGAAFGPIVAARVMNLEPPAVARLLSIVTGFGLTVLFYTYGTLPPETLTGALEMKLGELARLPGDPFERLVPFIPATLIAFMWPSIKNRKSTT